MADEVFKAANIVRAFTQVDNTCPLWSITPSLLAPLLDACCATRGVAPCAGLAAPQLLHHALAAALTQALRPELERGLPASLLRGARGLALLSVMRVGAGWSCTAGSGLVLTRQRSGAW